MLHQTPEVSRRVLVVVLQILRTVSLATFSPILAMALAALETTAFFAAALFGFPSLVVELTTHPWPGPRLSQIDRLT